MKPMDVLTLQTDMVENFIANQWREMMAQAQDVLPANFGFSRVLIGGCGDSHHAALGLEYAFSTYTASNVVAMTSMQLARYGPTQVHGEMEDTLVIGISASGEVARTLEAIEIWKELGAYTVALSSNGKSSLAEAAHVALTYSLPDIPHGPGLVSYIGSLMLGYAIAVTSMDGHLAERLSGLIDHLPALLSKWVHTERESATAFAEKVRDGIAVFLGSGPTQGSACFGAAKVIEAAGECCWAQDLEEWAHLEYFCEPANMPTVLLSAGGRAHSREVELRDAMDAIGRSVLVSQWTGSDDWTLLEREVISPLALWVAPCAYASARAQILAEKPFRGFGGGRDQKEGGGPSRIRSSQRLSREDIEKLDLEKP